MDLLLKNIMRCLLAKTEDVIFAENKINLGIDCVLTITIVRGKLGNYYARSAIVFLDVQMILLYFLKK